MGRAGSIIRSEGGEKSTSLACILSVRRASGKEDDNPHTCHIVDCKMEGNSATLQQRFTSLGPEDPEGKAAALCFALSTGSLTAFRAFLFEHFEFWGSRSGDGYNASFLTGVNMQGCLTVFVSPRKNTALGLWFTAALCRLQNGCLRSVSFQNDSEQVGIERVTRFLHGSKCRKWVYRVLKGNLTSEPGPVPSICKRCGESEDPAYHDQKSQQVCKDYQCSACLMMEKEVILAIRLEEQSEGTENWEKFLNEGSSVCMEDNCDTCCICGCEDNEELDDLVPCACESGQAVVHTSCAAACTSVASPKLSNLDSTPMCLICSRGKGIMRNGGLGRCQDDGKEARGSKRSMISTEVAGVELKRPQTTSADGVMQVEKFDSLPKIVERERNVPALSLESENMDCTKMVPARHGWRSVEVPAVVPFKKRRIQVIEVPRSPSSPPKQNSPKVVPLSSPRTPSLLSESTSVKPAPKCLPLDSPSNATSLLPGFPPTSLPSLKSMTPALVLYCLDKLPCVPNSPLTRASPEQPQSFPSPPQPPQQVCSSPRSLSPVPTSLPPKLLIRSSGSSSPQQTCPPPITLSPKPTSIPSELSIRSSGSSPSHCHKLLNVETSEHGGDSLLKPLGQLPGTYRDSLHCRDALKVIKESHVSYKQSRCSANQDLPSSSQEVEDGELVISTEKGPEDFEVAGESPEVSSQEAGGHYSRLVRSNPQGIHDDQSDWDLNANMDTWDKLSSHVCHVRKKVGKGSRIVCDSIKRSIHMSRQILTVSEPLQNSSSKVLKGHIDTDKHNECGISLHQKLEANSVAFSKGASVQQSEELGKLECRNNAPGIEKSTSWKEDEKTSQKQRSQKYSFAPKWEDQAGLLRKEWDELGEDPQGEEQVDHNYLNSQDGDDAGVEMAERALVLEDEAYWRVETTKGDAFLWESKRMSDGGGGKRGHVHLIEPWTERCSTSGRVKSSGWDQLPEGFNSAEEALKAAQEIFHHGCGHWANPGGKGPTQGSLSGNRCNSSRDEFRDSCDGCAHEPSHHRESYSRKRRLDNDLDDYSAARGRGLRREAAEVHGRGNINGSDNRHRGSSGQWGSRQPRSSSGFSSQGATNAAAAAAARVESSGFVVAPDGTISRRGRPSQALQSTFEKSHRHSNGQAPSTDLESGSYPSRRIDRHLCRSSNPWTDMRAQQGAGLRYAGGRIDRGALVGRGNEDRDGGSHYSGQSAKLRSESLHRLHPSDHSHMSSRAHCHGPESKVTRSRLSPASPAPYRLSKVFPDSARGWGSPPVHRWFNDRREAENSQERDFKCLVSRSHGSFRRASPHVVHGSSLMDERDWRVLADTRTSPGASVGLNSAVHSGRAMDGTAELYRIRQAEKEKHTHSISKNSDRSRNSPREINRARGSAFKSDRSRDNDMNRESHRLSSRSTGVFERASSRNGDNDTPPRRHHPSW